MTQSSVIPRRCLWLYGRGLALVASDAPDSSCTNTTALSSTVHSGLDALSTRGISGPLVWGDELQSRQTAEEELAVLLGIASETDCSARREAFRKRFGRLRVSLFTDASTAYTLGKELGLPGVVMIHPQWLDCATTLDSAQQEILAKLDAPADDVDMYLVYLTCEQTTTVKPSQRIAWLDALCSAALARNDAAQNLLVTTLSPSASTTATPAAGDCFSERETYACRKDERLSALRPAQSFALFDGHRIESSQRVHGLYSVCHDGSTRIDAALKMTEEAVALHGSGGSIHACQLLTEVAFKLGCTPKYGA